MELARVTLILNRLGSHPVLKTTIRTISFSVMDNSKILFETIFAAVTDIFFVNSETVRNGKRSAHHQSRPGKFQAAVA